MPLETFINKLQLSNPNLMLDGDFTNTQTKTWFKCRIHGERFYSTPNHMLRGQTGCGECLKIKNHESGLKTHERFVADLYEVNKNIEVIGQYQSAKRRIEVRCLKCGQIWKPEASSLLCGYGCPKCKQSKGEKIIKGYLQSHDISFIEQKKFDNLRGKRLPLSYDFYLPDYNLLIEYQGEFHDGSTSLIPSEKYLHEQIMRDNKKRKYASENGYNLLEIWYYDKTKISEIMDEYLQNNKNPVTTTVA